MIKFVNGSQAKPMWAHICRVVLSTSNEWGPMVMKLNVPADWKGIVKSNRSIWHLRTITDFFWAVINFICVFFATMFSMEKSDGYKKLSGSSKKWDGGGPLGPLQGLDNVRDIKHNSLPACGSCCGG